VQDFVPKDHLSRFIVELVRESLELSEILGSYRSALGQPPFDPRLMVALLLNGYASGIYSSRRIAKACVERADFMMIAALDAPDFRTISEFRKRHLKQLAELFVQVLKLAEKAGLVRLGHVFGIRGLSCRQPAIDLGLQFGLTLLHMPIAHCLVFGRIRLDLGTVQRDDKLYGNKRGDELPDWVADKQKRIARIAEAKAELEAEAKAAVDEERRIEAEKQKSREAEGRKKTGKPAAPPSDEPAPKAQRNFTDPQSRILKTKDGFIQGYNAQAAVDGKAQIIVAHELTPSGSDHGQLVPLLDGIQANLGRKPEQASADSGYLSEANLASLDQRGIDGYIATGRAKHPTADNGKVGGPLTQAMRKKIADGGFETPYRLRKQIVEAVFGQIKQARGFRQFLLRGLENVAAEWAIICTAHNLVKLATFARAA
jgi:transposase